MITNQPSGREWANWGSSALVFDSLPAPESVLLCAGE
jgi:hypothetical protein